MELENNCIMINEEDGGHIELPPGFRFHPTDEELISHYLLPKVANVCFFARAIGEVDLNKSEPWELPWRAKMGESEWYFFCVRDRKYPTGLRTNRATEAGYWKATGKDKEICKGKLLVGMKKTLVFYKGRAPKGEKTNWIIHEYRLEGNFSAHSLLKTAKNEWVICRVFHKNHGGRRTHISRMVKPIIPNSPLPPLIESSPCNNKTMTNTVDISHVTCFSNQREDHKQSQEAVIDALNTSLLNASSFNSLFAINSVSGSVYNPQIPQNLPTSQYPDCVFMTEQYMKQNLKPELSPETAGFSTDMSSVVTSHELAQEGTSISGGPVDIDCLWNY